MKNHLVKITEVSLALLFAVLFAPRAEAQSTWDGGGANDNWTTPGNWLADAVPSNDGTVSVAFAGAARLTPQVDTPQNILRIIFASGASGFNVGGGALTLQSTAFGSTTSAIINNSAALQTISSSITMGATGGNSGIYAANGALSLTGNITNNTRKLILGGTKNISISGNASGVGNNGYFLLDSEYTGTLTLSGSNTYTGNNEVRGGTLRVASANALGVGTGDTVLGAGTGTPSLIIGGAYSVSQNVMAREFATGPVTVGGDTADISIFSGTIKLGNAAGRHINLTAAAGGTVRFDGDIVTSTSGSDNLDAVTKIGAGTVILAGSANSYSGTTTVSTGTLLVNGTYSVAGDSITAESGAAFGGTGTVDRAVTIMGGASLIGGDGATSGGGLTLDGDLVLEDNSMIQLTLGAGGNHSALIRNGGLWEFDSNQLFLLNASSAGEYLGIITGLTGLEAGLDTIASWTIANPAYAGSTFTFDSGNVNLTLVPEPSSSLLIGLGLSCILYFRMRRH